MTLSITIRMLRSARTRFSLSIDTQHNGTQNNNNTECNTQQNDTSETVLQCWISYRSEYGKNTNFL